MKSNALNTNKKNHGASAYWGKKTAVGDFSMILLLILCLCLMGTGSAASMTKEMPEQETTTTDISTQTPDFSETEYEVLESFSHLISIIGSKGPRSEKRLARLSRAMLNFNALYKEGSHELKESLAALASNLTKALSTTAWSTHTKEVRVNALLRLAFADIEQSTHTLAQKALLKELQNNLHIGLAPALIGLRETIRKKLPLKTLLALTILVGGGFAAYKMSLGKRILHRVIDTTKNKLAPELAALTHIGTLAQIDRADLTAYEEVKNHHPTGREIYTPHGAVLFMTEDGTTYQKPRDSLRKGIDAFAQVASMAPSITQLLAEKQAKDREWFSAHHIMFNEDGTRKMVRVTYGQNNQMRYLSSETVNNPSEDQKAQLMLYEQAGTWHKTYLPESMIPKVLDTADRGIALGVQALSILDRPEIIGLLKNINEKLEVARTDFIAWAREKNIWDNENQKLRDEIRADWDETTQTITYISSDGTRHVAPTSLGAFIFRTIRDLTAPHSGSMQLVKVITQQIKVSLDNYQLFLQSLNLWDTDENAIKTSIFNNGTKYSVSYGQENGKPYYEVSFDAFDINMQRILRQKVQDTATTQSATTRTAIALQSVLESESSASAASAGAGAGAGAGSGSSTTPPIIDGPTFTYAVTIAAGLVRIYTPLSPTERLFLVLDKIDIRNPIEFVNNVLQAATNFRGDSIDEILSVLHGVGANRFINTKEQERRVAQWRSRTAKGH